MTTDRIEKSIEMKATVERVWRALTDHKEMGEWFGLEFKEAFAPGKTMTGWNRHINREQTIVIQQIEPQSRFSLKWHPYGTDSKTDPATLIEFTLEKIPAGTRLHVVESGFDQVPAHLRAEAFRMHTGGWEAQLKNIKNYVE